MFDIDRTTGAGHTIPCLTCHGGIDHSTGTTGTTGWRSADPGRRLVADPPGGRPGDVAGDVAGGSARGPARPGTGCGEARPALSPFDPRVTGWARAVSRPAPRPAG